MLGWIRKKIAKIQEKRKLKKEAKKLKKLAKKQKGQIPIEEQDNNVTLNPDEPVDTAPQLDDMDNLTTDEAGPIDMVVEIHAHMAQDDHMDPEVIVHDDVSTDTPMEDHADMNVADYDSTAEDEKTDPEEAVLNDKEVAVSTDTQIDDDQADMEVANPNDTVEDNYADQELPNHTEIEPELNTNYLEQICADPQVIALAGWIIESLRHRWYSDDTVFFYWKDPSETKPNDPLTEQTTDTKAAVHTNTDLEGVQDHRETGEASGSSIEKWIPVCMEIHQKVRVNRCGSEPDLTDVSNNDPIQYVRNHERFKRRRWDLAPRPSFLSSLKKTTERK